VVFPYMHTKYFDQIHFLLISLSHPSPLLLKIILTVFIILFSCICEKYLDHIWPLLSPSPLPLVSTPKQSLFCVSSSLSV
jgi:hypothetical protein